jgi:hypothetical protein
VVLWEAFDRVCGKRLRALLPSLVPALERDPCQPAPSSPAYRPVSLRESAMAGRAQPGAATEPQRQGGRALL